METRPNTVNLKVTAEPDLEVLIILDDPEEMAVREGIHERIQTEIYHEDREREKCKLKKCWITLWNGMKLKTWSGRAETSWRT